MEEETTSPGSTLITGAVLPVQGRLSFSFRCFFSIDGETLSAEKLFRLLRSIISLSLLISHLQLMVDKEEFNSFCFWFT